MSFHAYDGHDRSLQVDYEWADDSDDRWGRLTAQSPPFATAYTLEDAIQLGYAYLGEHPDSLVYVADDERRVHRTLVCDGYHDALARQAKWHFMAWTMLLTCMIAFILTVALQLGALGLFGFAVAIAFYVLIVQTGLANEVEGGLACLILLTLALLTAAAINVRNKAADEEAPSNSAVPTTNADASRHRVDLIGRRDDPGYAPQVVN